MYDVEEADMLNQLLRLCGQERLISFDEALRICQEGGAAHAPEFRKLGEGAAADVYLFRRGASDADECVLKVIPVGGNQLVDGCKPQSLAGTSAEVAIARAYCVQGPYHPALLACWKVYETRFFSQNENPEAFGDMQLYLILEFEYGGKPLENFKGSVEQLESVFVQVSCSLAVAELALQFEHRDLHGENVLVRRTKENHATYILEGEEIKVPTAGVWASVVDYTLSRISAGTPCDAAGLTRSLLFTDLARDSQLFEGSGSYQYDIYRIMRERNGNDWKAFEPATNVLWLDYLARKLRAKRPTRAGGSGSSLPSCARLAQWGDSLLSFPSAGAFVTHCLFPAPLTESKRRRKEHLPDVDYSTPPGNVAREASLN
ncbi:serine/threonine-protein kinase haspin-like isoform X2 [Haemaphysalis longicornis]